jgi:hypothetical protein
MKVPPLLLILSFACHTSFSQTADSVQQIDLCSNLQNVKSISLPFEWRNVNYSHVRLSVASLKAINKAALLSLSEDERDCVEISALVDDENFKSDFDTLNTDAYEIVRILPAKSINNQMLMFVLVSERRGHTYLITFNRTGSRNNCMKARSAVRLGFAMGNRHWSHRRDADFMNDNKIKVMGECWHENDELGPLSQLLVMLTIQKDGTIVKKEMPVTSASKSKN